MKLRKCHFFVREIQYLGHILNITGIKPLPSKTAAIRLMNTCKMAKQVRAFAGTCWLLLQVYQEFCLHSQSH